MLKTDFQWQTDIVQSTRRIRVLMGGRGVAKTTAVGRNTLLSCALGNINHLYGYFAPSYARALFEQRKMARNRILKPFIEEARDQPYPYVKFITGSQVNFRSSDREENLLGDHLNGAVIDETHKLGERLWDEVIRPQLGAKRGWALHLGQHDDEGEDGWICKRFEYPSREPGNTLIGFWRIPSSMGFMYSGEDGAAELARIKATTPDLDFRRQYLAEPVARGNRAFRAEDLAACTGGEGTTRAERGRQYVAALDLGRMVDPSAYVVLEASSRESATLVCEGLRPLGEHHEIGAQEMARVCRDFGNPICVVDTTGGGGGRADNADETDRIVKYYRENIRTMRPMVITRKSKYEMVQALQLAIEQHRLKIPASMTKTLAQLSKYRWERKNGFLIFAGPNGHEDDLICALFMAWQGVVCGWFHQAGQAGPGSII